MRPSDKTAELVEQGDLDELVRHVDRLCDARDWDGLVDLRDRCRRALERGKQLWPAASLVEYRLALEAPGAWAGAVLEPGAGHFALGPLQEVAASSHAWEELADHVPPGPMAAITAHERVVRGEDLRGDQRIPSGVLDIPLVLAEWEPGYAVAVYEADKARFPAPAPISDLVPARLPDEPPEVVGDPEACRALSDLAGAWVEGSNGRAAAVCVEGDAAGAIRALGIGRARLADVELDEAIAHMAWTGASGGAHGRRRGAAVGRFNAWWAVAALTGMVDHWPVEPDELGAAASELLWFLWDADEPETGWSLRLAVEHPDEGLAWAVAASDYAAD